MKKIKVLIIDTKKGFRIETINNSLDDFYSIIDCDCIDIATRKIGNNGKYYDIICDDEGLLKGSPKVSAISPSCNSMLVGNLIITNYNSNGETTSLTEDDIDYLLRYCQIFRHRITGETIPLLTEVDY